MPVLSPLHALDLLRIDEETERILEGLVLIRRFQTEAAGQFLRSEELVGIPSKKFEDVVGNRFDGISLLMLFNMMREA